MTIESSNKRSQRRWMIVTIAGSALAVVGPLLALALPGLKLIGDCLGLAGAALAALGGVCVWVFSERVSSELDQRVDDAENKVGKATARADLLEERARQVESALEIERTARATLERHVAPRTVSSDQLSVICNELAGVSDAPLVWMTTTGDPEVVAFAEALGTALLTAGMQVKLSTSAAIVIGGRTTGIDVMVVAPEGGRIAAALLKANVIAPTQVRSRDESAGLSLPGHQPLPSVFPEATVLCIRVLPKEPHV